MCCWRSDWYFEAIPVEQSAPNSVVNGVMKSMPGEKKVRRCGRGRDSFLGETLLKSEL